MSRAKCQIIFSNEVKRFTLCFCGFVTLLLYSLLSHYHFIFIMIKVHLHCHIIAADRSLSSHSAVVDGDGVPAVDAVPPVAGALLAQVPARVVDVDLVRGLDLHQRAHGARSAHPECPPRTDSSPAPGTLPLLSPQSHHHHTCQYHHQGSECVHLHGYRQNINFQNDSRSRF